MKAIVSIIMGSTSDMPVMEKAAKFLDQMEIPFEINALSAHRTPQMVEKFATNAKNNGIKKLILFKIFVLNCIIYQRFFNLSN